MIGKTISHYRIIEELGRGGMGVVYEALDTKLERTVALKFLSPGVIGSEEEKARFLREAQAAAALSHPNICTIYEINEFEGQSFIAMEYVEGESLRSMLERGPLQLEQVMDIGMQLAAGLQEAHEKGIVHRDVKPANIMITPKGRVKIMDFGLAKLHGQTLLTKEGTTLGTVSYMSPEQARGGEIDHRTDIWSLGVVLYEMLAGARPFRGDYEQAVLYSILNMAPEPVGRLRTDVPTGLDGIVSRAMDKNRETRYRNAADIVRDLKILRDSRSGVVARPAAKGNRNAIFAVVFTAVVIAAGVLIVGLLSRRGKQAPPPVSRQVTHTGTVSECALSPDGNYIAYRNSSSAMVEEIWVKDLGSGSALEVYSNMLAWNMKWSPDGSRLLFNMMDRSMKGGVCIIPRFGGAVRQLTDSPWMFTSWSPDGSRIAIASAGDHAIRLIDIESGSVDTVFIDGIDTEIRYPEWSPSGRLILFQTENDEFQKLWIARIDGTDPTLILEEEYGTSPFIMHPKWSPGGRAVYYLDGEMRGRLVFDLMKIPVDAETGKARGRPVCVMAGLHASANNGIGSFYSISNDGTLLLYAHDSRHSNIWLVTVEGEEGEHSVRKEQLTTGTTWKSVASISPGGDRIAFAMGDANAMNIYTMPIDGNPGEPEQLTFFESLSDMPAWSPDGREIAFLSNHDGSFKVWRVGVDGGMPEPFEGSAASMDGDGLAWAPGTGIIYRAKSTGLDNFTLLDPRDDSERLLLVDPPPGYTFDPIWSPDGRRIALFWNMLENNRQIMRTWIVSLDDGSRRVLCDEVTAPIAWSGDGQWIYLGMLDAAKSGTMGMVYRISSEGGTPEQYVRLPFERGLQSGRLAMTSDGRKFVYSQVEEQTDVWIVEHFDPDVNRGR